MGIRGLIMGFLVLNAKNVIVGSLGLSQLMRVHGSPGLETETEGEL